MRNLAERNLAESQHQLQSHQELEQSLHQWQDLWLQWWFPRWKTRTLRLGTGVTGALRSVLFQSLSEFQRPIPSFRRKVRTRTKKNQYSKLTPSSRPTKFFSTSQGAWHTWHTNELGSIPWNPLEPTSTSALATGWAFQMQRQTLQSLHVFKSVLLAAHANCCLQ